MKKILAGAVALLFSWAGYFAAAGGPDVADGYYAPNGTIYAPRKFFVGSKVTPYQGFSPIDLDVKYDWSVDTYVAKVVPDGNTGYWFVEFLTVVTYSEYYDDGHDFEKVRYTTTLYLKSGQDWVFFDINENRSDHSLSDMIAEYYDYDEGRMKTSVYDKKKFLEKGPPFISDDGKREYLEDQVYNLVEGRCVRYKVKLSPNCIEFVSPDYGDEPSVEGLYGFDVWQLNEDGTRQREVDGYSYDGF